MNHLEGLLVNKNEAFWKRSLNNALTCGFSLSFDSQISTTCAKIDHLNKLVASTQKKTMKHHLPFGFMTLRSHKSARASSFSDFIGPRISYSTLV